MKATMMSTAALAMGLVLAAQAAYAQNGARLNDPAQLQREHNRAVAAGDWANDPYDSRSSDDLNRQQLDNARAAGSPYVYDNQPPLANSVADTGASYSSDQQYNNAEPENTYVTIVGNAHDVTENAGQPDTNPQSTGTPSIDTPYVVSPGIPIRPDDNSTGMTQPET